jgi:hypothetical protein
MIWIVMVALRSVGCDAPSLFGPSNGCDGLLVLKYGRKIDR